MGAPSIPLHVPAERFSSLTIKLLPEVDGIEASCFSFLKDTQQWVVDDEEDKAEILAHYPNAKFLEP